MSMKSEFEYILHQDDKGLWFVKLNYANALMNKYDFSEDEYKARKFFRLISDIVSYVTN